MSFDSTNLPVWLNELIDLEELSCVRRNEVRYAPMQNVTLAIDFSSSFSIYDSLIFFCILLFSLRQFNYFDCGFVV
jgi:hypothetical protein